jgi:hypothetical protein
MKVFFKRTITIYTDYDPGDLDIEDLSREAMAGNGYYTYVDHQLESVDDEPDLLESEFFYLSTKEDNEE